MTLLASLILAQQHPGIHGTWKVQHTSGCYLAYRLIRNVKHGDTLFYEAYGVDEERIIVQSERLEIVLHDFAQRYPFEVGSDGWKVHNET
jgi:hypothetical protein